MFAPVNSAAAGSESSAAADAVDWFAVEFPAAVEQAESLAAFAP